MVSAIFRFFLAVAGAAVALGVVMCAVTGRWPTVVVVESKLEDARCAFAFSDGFTWEVELGQGQERFWLFALGRPDRANIACRSATRMIERTHYFCDSAFEQRIRLTEDAAPVLCLAR